jgi:hypothetical protein
MTPLQAVSYGRGVEWCSDLIVSFASTSNQNRLGAALDVRPPRGRRLTSERSQCFPQERIGLDELSG